jgi:hypothetical protein
MRKRRVVAVASHHQRSLFLFKKEKRRWTNETSCSPYDGKDNNWLETRKHTHTIEENKREKERGRRRRRIVHLYNIYIDGDPDNIRYKMTFHFLQAKPNRFHLCGSTGPFSYSRLVEASVMKLGNAIISTNCPSWRCGCRCLSCSYIHIHTPIHNHTY